MNLKGVTIYLKTDVEELVKRLSHEKETRPLIKGLTNETLKDYISEKLDDREPFYSKAVYHFNTAFLTNDNFQKIIRQYA